MKHYICTGGCDGASSNPKVCDAEGCKKEGEPLVPCDCENDLHEGVDTKDAEDAD